MREVVLCLLISNGVFVLAPSGRYGWSSEKILVMVWSGVLVCGMSSCGYGPG